MEERHSLALDRARGRAPWRPPSRTGARWCSAGAASWARILGAGAGVMGVVLAFPLLRSLGPQPKKTFDTTDWRTGLLPRRPRRQAGPPGRPRGGRRAHGVPRGLRRGLGRPDHADPRPRPTRHRHPARARDLGAQGVPGVLQDVHPRRMPGGPVRGGDPAVAVPVPPVAVRRRDGRQPGVRARPPSAAAASPHIDSAGLPAWPRPATTSPSGPGFWERS